MERLTMNSPLNHIWPYLYWLEWSGPQRGGAGARGRGRVLYFGSPGAHRAGQQRIPRLATIMFIFGFTWNFANRDAKIHQNVARLTHFIEESNTGKGFIKEQCFSPCGRWELFCAFGVWEGAVGISDENFCIWPCLAKSCQGVRKVPACPVFKSGLYYCPFRNSLGVIASPLCNTQYLEELTPIQSPQSTLQYNTTPQVDSFAVWFWSSSPGV